MTRELEAVVIGAGPAGLGAAAALRKAGIGDVAVLDRESTPGGILLQCIHNGFGLHRYGEDLTGPEYADRCLREAETRNVQFLTETSAIDLIPQADGSVHVMALGGGHGLHCLHARAVVLAMGCRERNRGSIAIPGSRPAGIMTAGLAQRFVNLYGYLPGREIVILGSGDIGLIMARRLTWEGATVKAVVEIQPCPGGLTRNVVQCLEDFHIPLYLSHTVTRIHGNRRIDGVDVAPIDTRFEPEPEKTFHLPCDCLLLSVGLIPENELSLRAGIDLHSVTGGPRVDSRFMTSVPGIFACGNVLQVHDLVDWVTDEATRCGACAAAYIQGQQFAADPIRVVPGSLVRYVLPTRISPRTQTPLCLRPMAPAQDMDLVIRDGGGSELLRKRHPVLQPSIMIRQVIPDIPPSTERIEVALEPHDLQRTQVAP